MAVVLLTSGYETFNNMAAVMAKANARPFPKVPDPIFDPYAALQHVLISPENLSHLKAAAQKAGMYVLTDRWAAQRIGPTQPGKKIEFNLL
jgi:hypothetical protein